ncbi:hypothetical protein [uncultured Polaribacter sp.]|uniref:hypothetical protein n=1 Tax=uncultured Polaribacter sp. TaxID=174711 RepID=UPI002636765F|nr:hypothetical protein [uncultured Polaribacter sp.]
MKTYNKNNFFKHTFCEFTQIDDFDLPKKTVYVSKSNSMYFYTDEGVYRKSNHWGRVANCRWKLIANKNYKNQNTVTAFAKWDDFYPINSSEKNFYIDVNFDKKTVVIRPKKEKEVLYLFSLSEAQKRSKQIMHLFKNDKWAKYFENDIEILRVKIISDFINSNLALSEIKRRFK